MQLFFDLVTLSRVPFLQSISILTPHRKPVTILPLFPTHLPSPRHLLRRQDFFIRHVFLADVLTEPMLVEGVLLPDKRRMKDAFSHSRDAD